MSKSTGPTPQELMSKRLVQKLKVIRGRHHPEEIDTDEEQDGSSQTQQEVVLQLASLKENVDQILALLQR